MYAEYFQPYPNIFEPILRSQSITTRRSQAFQAYEQHHYQQAASLFSELLKEKKDVGALMLRGNSNLILGNTEAAKQDFMEILNSFEDFDIQAKWYLSLCYLKNGDTAMARDLLTEISGTETPEGVQAVKLLKALD